MHIQKTNHLMIDWGSFVHFQFCELSSNILFSFFHLHYFVQNLSSSISSIALQNPFWRQPSPTRSSHCWSQPNSYLPPFPNTTQNPCHHNSNICPVSITYLRRLVHITHSVSCTTCLAGKHISHADALTSTPRTRSLQRAVCDLRTVNCKCRWNEG